MGFSDACAQAAQWLCDARRVAVLTGAGVSAESGVPTFRDAQTGYWAQFRAEDMASEPGFLAHPGRVWRWYQYRRELVAAVQPNAGHLALARWQQQHPGRLTLITQNVDGLHRRAGSEGVLHLHGDLMADRWLRPARPCCDLACVEAGEPPRCPVCGNLVRPAVVWFGEALPAEVLRQAGEAARGCDVMLVVGTSGQVYPAAGLAHEAGQAGARVVIVNPEPSALDGIADLRLVGPSASVLPALFEDA
ncbi:MAG: SIR2 family NAD-dependent protein deacylase [Comamonas sp.]